ncbi:hypothetical protein BH23PLA1_BH23PLA1_20960 [soil metagenome]
MGSIAMPTEPPNLLTRSGLQVADYVVMFVYMGALLCVGIYLARRQKTSEAFFVGGRRMPWALVGISMLATLMSTLTYLGSPGEVIQHGLGRAFGLIALPFAFVVIAFVWVPFFMRLRLTSAYEYLELRFGRSVRLLGVALFLYMRLLWMGLILYTASMAIALMTEATGPQALETLTGGLLRLDERAWFYFVLLFIGVLSTAYTALGGIEAVIWTDTLQFLTLFGGAVLTILLVAFRTDTGPMQWWTESSRLAHSLPPLASWDLTTRVTVLTVVLNIFFWQICTHCSDQVALQRYFSTDSAASARRTAMIGMGLDVVMQVVLVLVGMALLTYYLHHAAELPAHVTDPRAAGFADRIFPHFIAHGLPVGVSGLVLAAVFAVAQSSIDSGINSSATVISVDLLRKRGAGAGPLNEAAELRMAKLLTLVIGAFVIAAGLLVAQLPERYNIIDLTMKSFNTVLGPLAAVFMAGFFLRHVGELAALCAGMIGAASGLLLAFAADLLPGWRGPSMYLVIPLSWAITFGTAALLGLFLPKPLPERLAGLTWFEAKGRSGPENGPGPSP